MKIAVVNGSHRGKSGNTNIMVSALLKGAQEAGAETVNIFLAEKEIKYCRACKSCWFNNPGKCVINDDMPYVLTFMDRADVWIFATPLYFDNISGMLKVFMDRMIVTGNPYWEKDKNGECRHLPAINPPKLMMIANCGYPEKSQFQVISHWIKRVARNMSTEVIGEIYASQGTLLGIQTGDVGQIVSNYLQVLEAAGKEIASGMRLSEKTKELLKPNFIPDEIYIQEVRRYVDSMLKE
jgi:putative NADPH-quinone reductase